jgi:hypothetical protein
MATIEQLSAALIKADAAGNSADAKVFADEIRRLRAAPQAEPAETSLAQDIGQGVGNLAAGALRGAGSIGATLMRPFDTATENQQRRQSMDDALQSMGAEPDSWMYKGGKLGGEIAGTAGAGGVLAQGITRLAPAAASAPRIAQVLEALKSGGFTLGGKASATLGGKAADVGIRALGGAASGGAQAGMIDPNEAGFGALIGGSLPVGVQAAGKVAGGVGNVVRYVNRPSEIKLANKLAQSLGMSVDDLSRAVTQTGPNMLPGYQPTVPQILQNPVTSQLQRTLKTAGANGLGDAERVQQGAFREALERVAPIDVTVQDAAARAGDAIKGFAVPARADASFNVRQAFDAVDPFGESALTLPIDEMKAAAGKYLGKGTFGTGSRANEAIATAERVGTQTLPGVAPLKATANNSQTLEKAVRAAGGIKGGSGELRDLGIKQSGTTGLVNNKTGQSADLLAAEMYRRGFITDADPATLFDALRNGSGRKLYANDQVESNVMQRMSESAMGEMPLDEVIPKSVPFSMVQNLRSSIGEAAEVARAKGANKEGAALEQMIKEIDARVNSGGAAGDFFPKDMADQYRAALNMHAD